ncbi:ABC transporter, permease protein 1 (cluster 5, nickel/peptides/opines) [hydrothermal vent metagenome]|uniref:ABC transporter, permease protein 1 (Cluster 5, nickel/peptides/opines) n=1 Tax=hydrothermal vent metagenome TaxID=652676 RepID=A0A3B0RM42_9ZZZZ
MFTYIIRRLLYAVPILIGVNLLTTLLFFYVNTPDDMARMILGEKNLTPEIVESWKKDHGYDQPLFINSKEKGISKVTQTIFFQKSAPLLWLDFGSSDRNNVDIAEEIKGRMWASLAIAIPTFIIGIATYLTFSMLLAYARGTYLDIWGVTLCVVMMSVSALFYIIGGQFIFGKMLKLFPISGYDTGIHAAKFVILPVIIGIIGSVGGAVRFYRTVFLEELGKDYIRTARAKGLTERSVLFKHALKNAMIPILTNVVVSIPFLFYGSLIMESFFAIPGLGSFTIDAIGSQDFAIVRAMVYLGSLLYIAGLILTDISYTLADPRIRLE